ncbi:MAG: hypothetical protein V4722_25420 [Bacteroidota bacterium]
MEDIFPRMMQSLDAATKNIAAFKGPSSSLTEAQWNEYADALEFLHNPFNATQQHPVYRICV